MYNSVKTLLAGGLLAVSMTSAADYNKALDQFGRPATAEEVAAWDIDVRPDFLGLPPGSGNAEDGEQLWLDKCAMCHGDFGDSNEVFSPLVLGNITPEDMEAGRVAALMDPAVVRTTFMKVNSLSTVWDYINRAMPWNAPKSLSTDEVYSLTAYLLSLAYIIEPDFELNQDSIHEVQAILPNRNGMTTDHGLWSVNGKPDVQGSDCTSNCDVDTTITSSLPAYAMNQHGNLADQVRAYGPLPGIQTAPEEEAAAEPAQADPSELLAANGCLGCHQMDGARVGPGFNDVMAKYKGQADAVDYLTNKIKNGGAGTWGSIPMPPQAHLGDEVIGQLATWLAGK